MTDKLVNEYKNVVQEKRVKEEQLFQWSALTIYICLKETGQLRKAVIGYRLINCYSETC